MMTFLVILWLSLVARDVFCFESTPVSVGNKNSILKPLVNGACVIGGLVLGKRSIDGPVFAESVNLLQKTAVITGANSGLGKATAEKLASLGAMTYLLCKTPEKGQETAKEIQGKTGNKNVFSVPLDLRSLKSIENAAKEVRNRLDNIDILVNNAGVMALPRRTVTQDGFEAHIGINHLGHFALTGLLLDLLLKDDSGSSSIGLKRIVNVASAAHYFGHIDRSNLMLDKPGSYDPWPAYGNSKQANILFTTALAKRLANVNAKGRSSPLAAFTCHPGLCRTDLGRYAFDMSNLPAYLNPLVGAALVPATYVTKSSTQGAQTQIFLSASAKLSTADSGKYFDNSAPATAYPDAVNADLADWLWRESERLTGIKYL
jgi:NAD(P)-dependent dehydrogenase (short-subunit alcohol dehydrogenase family)